MAEQLEACYRAFGARVEQIRKVLGLTQEDLAKRVKLSRGSVANIETGRQRVLLHDVETFAEALGTTARGLMKGIWP
jgi:transcriptional regulator with XRE-family HTH domain